MSGARGFTARYHGDCDECGERVAPGDQIAYAHGDQTVHAGCAGTTDEPESPARARRWNGAVGEVCPVCCMTRAVNKTCGCSE